MGPDQQEAGLEKSDSNQSGGSKAGGESNEADKLGSAPTEPTGRAELDDSSKHAVLDAYSRCFDGCAHKSDAERATCQNDCGTQVSVGDGNPTMSACPRGCVKAFGSCLTPCSDKRSEVDLETCRKLCRAHATVCIDGCN
jgi:hypothetical protein